ncbi:MAG: TonB-dependent receptor [Gemmatimonadales bacterium]|nr:TonB-dependent receptor [Gemmatimonadales bacterium]
MVATLVAPVMLGAQERPVAPPPNDSTRAGPDSAVPLPALTVTRAPDRLEQAPLAVARVERDALSRGRLTIALDEALPDIPGLYVSNRHNFALDERIAIRGFGSRSSFGVRGVKILLDGVPQTLPDGQSQLSNVELGAVDRVEVIRGSASSRHGNAAGGVIAFYSRPAPQVPFAQAIRIQGGRFGTFKWQSRTAFRSASVGGTVSLSQLTTDGTRQHSRADIRKANAALEWIVSGRTALGLTLALSDSPTAENPGALTEAEYAANPDSSGVNSVVRDARKDVNQQQLALTLKHYDRTGQYSAVLYGLHRDLFNPIATNVIIDLERWAGGVRLDGSRRVGDVTIAAGFDLQRMRDDRKNFLGDGMGVPTDSLTVGEIETVTEVGPFAQVGWNPGSVTALWLSAGVRYDDVTFDVDDRHLTDGEDQSDQRSMSAWSWHAGASAHVRQFFTPYVNVSSSFQTPTTTELVNRPDGSGGLNPDLDPERAVTVEVGARGRVAGCCSYEAAVFQSTTRDAIIPFREVLGRSFFQNAGKTRSRGVEIGGRATVVPGLRIFGSYTYASYQFREYRLVDQATIDTLDGNRLPGVPRHFLRAGVRVRPGAGVAIDLDHTLSSSLYADDQNTLEVDGWGAGVTNLRVNVTRPVGDVVFAPFVGINNLFDRAYVGSVTINGFGGRVLEPSPGRNVYVGTEVRWRDR